MRVQTRDKQLNEKSEETDDQEQKTRRERAFAPIQLELVCRYIHGVQQTEPEPDPVCESHSTLTALLAERVRLLLTVRLAPLLPLYI